MARAISIARTFSADSSNTDSAMALLLLLVIGIASINTMGNTDLNAVQDGIEDFSHYRE